MVARRRLLTDLTRSELRLTAGAMLVTLLITAGAVHKFGNKGLFFPVALAIAIALLLRPLVAMCLTVLIAIVAEGNTFGLFTAASHVYNGLFKGLNIVDFLVVLTVVAVVLDLLRTRRQLRVPRDLLLPLAFLVLAMLVGVVMARQHGVGMASAVISESTLWYLIVLPLAVYNLDIPRPLMINLLRVTFVLAAVKAVL